MYNHVLIRLIRFVSQFTVHFYNTIYFSTIFSTLCKWFTKILRFAFLASKHSLKTSSHQNTKCRLATLNALEASTNQRSLVGADRRWIDWQYNIPDFQINQKSSAVHLKIKLVQLEAWWDRKIQKRKTSVPIWPRGDGKEMAPYANFLIR